MRVDPPDATPVQPPVPHEGHDIAVRHERRLMHLLVVCQKLTATAFVPDEEYPVHKIVAAHSVAAQQRVKLAGIRGPIRQETDPYGRVDEDDHAAECLAD